VDARVRPGAGSIGQGARALRTHQWWAGLFASGLVLLLLLMPHPVCSHPFDGDGAGPAKEGGSNAQAYLYVEPYQCRVECLIWLPTALEILEMPQGDALVLSPEIRAQLIEKARNSAASWCALKVNGVEQNLELVAATVLRGRPAATDTLKPDEAIGVMDAMLGLTWECGAPVDIKQVEIEWRKYAPAVPALPVTVSYGPIFESGMVLNAASPAGTWKNAGAMPAAKPLAPVPPVPEKPQVALRLGSILWIALVGGGVLLAGWLSWTKPQRALLSLGSVVLGAVALWPALVIRVDSPWQKPPAITVNEAQPVLQSLLRNTYRAFEQRDESGVYDVLARSIGGDLLQRIYLQTVQALTLEAQDGTRVKVSDLAVEVDSVSARPDAAGFVAHGEWTAFGRVGHWGHMHQRVNKYKANMTVEPVDGGWKLTGLEVLEEVRDFQKQPPAS
jgi:hypothetical protein